MPEKIFWTLLMFANLLGAYYFAIKDDIGFEIIDLFSTYLCWKELKDV